MNSKSNKSRTTLLKKSEIIGINYTYSVIKNINKTNWFKKSKITYKDVYTIEIFLKEDLKNPVYRVNFYNKEEADKQFNRIKRFLNDQDNTNEYLEITL